MKSRSWGISWGIVFIALALAIVLSCTTTAVSSGKDPVSSPQPVSQTRQITVQDLKITREEVQYADGVMASLTQSKYDTTGNLVLEEQYNGKKSLILKKTVEIQSGGKQAVMTTANPNGEVQGIAIMDYDVRGNLCWEI